MMADTARICQVTYMPSLYGARHLTEDHPCVVEGQHRYHQALREEIGRRMSAGQPVLVFFNSSQDMALFTSSEYHKLLEEDYPMRISIVTEAEKDVGEIVKLATQPIQKPGGAMEVRASFFTRVFGRGLDFGSAAVALDPRIVDAGGVHVIQAFFSKEHSEEIQIKGRTARAGRKGSYGMILLLEDLKKAFEGVFTEDDETKLMRAAGNSYEVLNRARSQVYTGYLQAVKKNMQEAVVKHASGEHYREFLYTQKCSPEDLIYRLLQINKEGQAVRGRDTILVIDISQSTNGKIGMVKQHALSTFETWVVHKPGNRMGIVLCSDDEAWAVRTEGSSVGTCLTDDPAVLKQRLDEIECDDEKSFENAEVSDQHFILSKCLALHKQHDGMDPDRCTAFEKVFQVCNEVHVAERTEFDSVVVFVATDWENAWRARQVANAMVAIPPQPFHCILGVLVGNSATVNNFESRLAMQTETVSLAI